MQNRNQSEAYRSQFPLEADADTSLDRPRRMVAVITEEAANAQREKRVLALIYEELRTQSEIRAGIVSFLQRRASLNLERNRRDVRTAPKIADGNAGISLPGEHMVTLLFETDS